MYITDHIDIQDLPNIYATGRYTVLNKTLFDNSKCSSGIFGW